MDGDKKIDLAVANATTVSLLHNKGDGKFDLVGAYSSGAGKSPLSGPLSGSIAAADFNGDGRSDLAVADFTYNKVSVLFTTCLP